MGRFVGAVLLFDFPPASRPWLPTADACRPARVRIENSLSPAFFRGKGRGGPGAGRMFVSFSSDEIFLHFFLTVFPLVHNIRYSEVTM